MQLITEAIRAQLLANWDEGQRLQNANDEARHDPRPVLKLFVPWGAATWLITEMVRDEDDTLFGLCDLGMGCPELGYLSLSELQAVRGPGGLTVERDIHWEPKHALSVYTAAARNAQRIVEDIPCSA